MGEVEGGGWGKMEKNKSKKEKLILVNVMQNILVMANQVATIRVFGVRLCGRRWGDTTRSTPTLRGITALQGTPNHRRVKGPRVAVAVGVDWNRILVSTVSVRVPRSAGWARRG